MQTFYQQVLDAPFQAVCY